MSPLLEAVFARLGEQLAKNHRPISTRAFLQEIRLQRESGAWKLLQQADLLLAELPEEQDEGDAGIFSTSLSRALTSAQYFSKADGTLQSQHVLWGLLREQTGVAGRWLRDKGLRDDSLDWSQVSDPAPEPVKPSEMGLQRVMNTLGVVAYFGVGLDNFGGPVLPLLGLLSLPHLVQLWTRVGDWSVKTDRCSRCQSKPELRAMRDRKTGLCRPCERHLLTLPTRNYLLILLALCLGAWFYLEIFPPLGWLVANLGIALVLETAGTVVHELGHLLVGLLVGYRIVSLHLGSGGLRRVWRTGSIWCYWQAEPLGGMVMALAPGSSVSRLRMMLFALGGPSANFLMAGLLWPVVREAATWNLSLAWCQGLAPLLTFFFVNLVMGLTNLWPGLGRLEGSGQLPTDGKTALDVWRASPELSPKLAEKVTMIQAEVYRRFGNAEAELLFLERVLDPEDRGQKRHRMYLLWQLERLQEALEIGRELTEADPDGTPEQRGVEWNSLAWAHFLVGDLEEADRLSARSLELLPNLPNVLGTRGEVLAARGQFGEGKALLEKAIQGCFDAESAAHNCKALSRIVALQGDRDEFLRLSRLVEKLDPKTGAYASLEAAVEDARERGHRLS